MSGETEERRKTPHSETLDNTVAIAKLIVTQERTSKDMDKLIKHIELILPVHAIIANLKNILYWGIFVATGFGTWITIEYFSIKEKQSTFIAVQKKDNKNLQEQITDNKNQIQYLKGRIKK